MGKRKIQEKQMVWQRKMSQNSQIYLRTPEF